MILASGSIPERCPQGTISSRVVARPILEETFMKGFSSNGDGKNRVPTNRIPCETKTAEPANPQQKHEQQIITWLADRYEQLDALWEAAEDDLRRFRLHTVVVTK